MATFTELWDKEVKSLAQDVLLTCKSDPCATHYVGSLIFYVEHDLVDGRDPRIRLQPCLGTLTDDHYYATVHPKTPASETSRLKELGQALNRLSELQP
jgi:hypothetical protein